KSKSTILKFSIENILFLLKNRVKLIVIACNTSSALALDYLKKIFKIPILGVIEPGVKKAIKVSKTKRIAVIGTKATVNSKSYENKIFDFDKNVKVFSKACPLFVPLVEEGILEGKLVEHVIDMYLGELKRKKIDTLILGCTHYPLLKREIEKYFKDVYIIDSAKEVALYTKEVLTKYGILSNRKGLGKRSFYVTDDPRGFVNLAKLFLKREITSPRVISY
ncbi:MAG: glutamate racemase, partial [Candidatus Aenigmatarchaeota archaeon]